ncbi:MAG TPA: hypothetical protein DHM44_02195 [Flexistipes sinusarabici]|uniref:Glycosyl transferase group 1 n=1 Tax=Flexistipes sinusarabici TaxID=2352 RepID=A0A3D5Q9E2_FLESI|nr:hypothetical protein [Flexistipes sinusarabici]
MKILHLDTGVEWRGGQRQALLLHQGLLKKGVESYLACNESGKLIEKCNENGIPYRYKGEINPLSVINLLKIIKSVKPDVVHSHDAHSLTPAVIAKYLKKDFKLIHTRRVDFHIKSNFISRWKYNNKNIDSLVAISEAVKNVLISDGITKPIEKIYSGLDRKLLARIPQNEKIHLKEKLRIKPDDYVVGSVGSFVPHKDFETLIRAFQLLCKEMSNVKLLLVGDGELLPEMKELADSLQIANNIIFTGRVENVGELMSIMDVFAATSKEEGLNTSVIEAMMYELPVIATRAGGLSEIVQDGYNGYLCNIRDYKCVYKKMNLLLNNNELREYNSNVSGFLESFNYLHMVDKYRELYGKA